MKNFRLASVAEQIAAHLQTLLAQGRWADEMPGVGLLSEELGVNHKAVEAALRLLEAQGVLVSQGAGRRRRIQRRAGIVKKEFKVAVLNWEAMDRSLGFIIELNHLLREAGHEVIEAPKTLMEMKMKVERVADLVKKTKADAWVVLSASHEVLTWFSKQEKPTYAIFGQHHDLPLAATRVIKDAAIETATRNLVKLGHRRIVMLIRSQHRVRQHGQCPATFLATLESEGIRSSPYVLPDWEETTTGFQQCLASLFQVTPPTALILDEANFYHAACHYLLSKGLRVPRDISLICMEDDPNFERWVPSVAHIRRTKTTLVPQVVRWATRVSEGKKDIRQNMIEAEYFPGGTVGPAPGRLG